VQGCRGQRYAWCVLSRMQTRDAMHSMVRLPYASTGGTWFLWRPAHSPVSAAASTVPQTEAGKVSRRWRRCWPHYSLSLLKYTKH